MLKKKVVIIGGGPAAMMLACSLNPDKFNISIYEKNAALGRKFLVAGKGGFNLTHSESLEQFAQRYYPWSFISPFLKYFSNTDFQNWLSSIGIQTYIGTSKRIFPVKGIKPIEVFKAIENQLQKNNVSVFYHHLWQGWKDKALVFSNGTESKTVFSDLVIFALGGASWKVTGSDGHWTTYFKEKGIHLKPFHPSNCAFKVNWDSAFIKSHHGQVLKNCLFQCGTIVRKGEAVITQFGIEGSGVYALSSEIRKQFFNTSTHLSHTNEPCAELIVDFKPELSLEEIRLRFDNRGSLSIKEVLDKKIKLTPVQIHLLKNRTSKEEYNSPQTLSEIIKRFPLQIIGFAPLDEAISTVGGIDLEEVSEHLELTKLPQHFCVGEMLDWDAPTGGYLLQACFSMGKFLADKLNKDKL